MVHQRIMNTSIPTLTLYWLIVWPITLNRAVGPLTITFIVSRTIGNESICTLTVQQGFMIASNEHVHISFTSLNLLKPALDCSTPHLYSTDLMSHPHSLCPFAYSNGATVHSTKTCLAFHELFSGPYICSQSQTEEAGTITGSPKPL